MDQDLNADVNIINEEITKNGPRTIQIVRKDTKYRKNKGVSINKLNRKKTGLCNINVY